MSDCREALLVSITNSLISIGMDPDDVNVVRNVVISNLDNYEITNRCTDVAIPDNSSEKLIAIYVGTILAEGKRKASAKAYSDFLVRFLHDINKPLIDVTTFDIRLWIANVKDRVAPKTINNYCCYLSAFYGWLQREEIIEKNPYSKVKTVVAKKTIKFPFTDTDIDKMRFACKTIRDRAIFELLLSSGVRLAELCALDINDVDLVKKEVRVYEGKGGKQRVTYMSEIAANYIAEYLSTRKDQNEHLFGNRNGKRISRRTVERTIKDMGDRANVVHAHPHKCRRTFATTLYHRGVDIKSIQTLMGHDSVETTMGYIYSDMKQIEYKYKECC